MVVAVIAILFLVSFILAWRQLDELKVPQEVKKLAVKHGARLWGTIIILKNKTVHYSSGSSSAPSPELKRSSSDSAQTGEGEKV